MIITADGLTASVIAPLAAQDKVPVITAAYAPLRDRPNPKNPFFVWVDPSIEAKAMADYVFAQGVSRVAVIGTLDSWEKQVSTAFAEEFTARGGTITYTDFVTADATDVKTPVTKLVATHPQAVFIGTYYQFVAVTKTLHEQQFNGKEYSLEIDEYLAGETKTYVPELLFASPESYTPSFIADYTAAYDTAPSLPAGQMYDATRILTTMLRNSTDRQSIITQLEELHTFEGASGTLSVTAQNQTVLPLALYLLHNGTITRVQGLTPVTH